MGVSIVLCSLQYAHDRGTIKRCIRIQKNCFHAFQKIIMVIHLTTTCTIITIFTLDGGFQLFWAAFDLPMTVVPLKVALGWDKLDFWALKKSNHGTQLDTHLCDYQIRSDLVK